MLDINLPSAPINIITERGKRRIYDFLRRRYVALTPEEWVRQHFTHYMVSHLGYPPTRLANEVTLSYNGMTKRCDTVLYDLQGLRPQMIVEYKAPHISITQKTFDQIALYAGVLSVNYLIVSNGMQHYCLRFDTTTKRYLFIDTLPHYHELI
ncbi:MAG: type I restriction enzyme HsdR N-terminal domain-containing protein [Bacteroidales bacterium]|nr:type I restriction enzyme HsdR N-terminal domain-containing protein [Bacteroidales bacterium]